MKKLTRKFRKSEHDELSLPTRDDPSLNLSRPIDSQEQEELVRSFERNQAQQNRFWRILFASLLFCFAAFLLYSIFQQVLSPWELRYHAYFMEEVHSWMIISADWVAVVACSLAMMGLLHDSKHHRQWIWYSFLTGITLAVFWLYYMMRLPRFRWDIIWLPLGPISGAGLCLYVDHLLIESSEEIRKLRGYMMDLDMWTNEEDEDEDEQEEEYHQARGIKRRISPEVEAELGPLMKKLNLACGLVQGEREQDTAATRKYSTKRKLTNLEEEKGWVKRRTTTEASRQEYGRNYNVDALTFNSTSHLSMSALACLPTDIVFLILDKLLEPNDHVRFTFVCKEWQSLAKQYHRETQRGWTICNYFGP